MNTSGDLQTFPPYQNTVVFTRKMLYCSFYYSSVYVKKWFVTLHIYK